MKRKLRKSLVTAVGPAWAPILKYSLPTFQEYAEAQNYDVIVEQIARDSADWHSERSRSARWSKPQIIKKILKNSDIVVWFDADIIICRYDEDISSHLLNGAFQAITMEHVPSENRVNPNMGVWVIRRCQEAFEFLNAIEEAGLQPGPWTDQGTILKILGWERGDKNYFGARPGLGNKYLLDTSWLPIGWNQPFIDRPDIGEVWSNRPIEKFPHAVHFMGMRNINERTRTMVKFYKSLSSKPVLNKKITPTNKHLTKPINMVPLG